MMTSRWPSETTAKSMTGGDGEGRDLDASVPEG